MKKAIITSIVILLAIVIAYLGLYIYSLSQVEVKRVSIDELQDISLTGFTLGGYIELYNGGVVPVGVDQIAYRVTLESSGNELTRGRINGGKISPGKSERFIFSSKINWIPTSEIAWGLITPGDTYAKISGTVYVADLKFIDIKIPFEKRINIEQYIKQFAKRKVEEVIEKITDTVTNVIDNIEEGIKSIGGKVMEGIGEFLR